MQRSWSGSRAGFLAVALGAAALGVAAEGPAKPPAADAAKTLERNILAHASLFLVAHCPEAVYVRSTQTLFTSV